VSDGNDYPELRSRLHDAVSEHVELDVDTAGSVLTGWLLVFETVGEDGRRGFHTRSADALGDRSLPPWTAEGWARYAAADGMFEWRSSDDADDEA
jgi:hypothetical protein